MFNTGVNQTVALYQGTFDTVQQAGEARDMFKAAMREVMAVAHAEGVTFTEEDFKNGWRLWMRWIPKACHRCGRI